MGNIHAQPMKLSNLDIDTNKDWNGKDITNINTLSVSNEIVTNSTISNLSSVNATIKNGDIQKIGTNLLNDIIKLSLIFK